VAVAVGLLAGLGAFTFVYARGYSYLRDDPGACANCHVMWEHYDAWLKSTHGPTVTCNDCHTPPGPVEAYVVKAQNGFWHSFYFTTGTYPDPLRITSGNRNVTERACRHCHEAIIAAIDGPAHGTATGDAGATARHAGQHLECMSCHANVGHMVR
jgi:cytochrome c nitrite reductase small subunit